MAGQHQDRLLKPPGRSGLGALFWLFHGAVPGALSLALALLIEATSFDLRASDAFYDFAAGGWPLMHSWWAEGVIHRAGRGAVVLIALGAVAAWGLSFRYSDLAPVRRRALFLALAITLGAGAVGFGKTLSFRHCPWDVDRYGGEAPYYRLFDAAPAGVPAGHCFPGAHAASGFALMSGYFLFRGRDRRWSLAGLAAGLVTGTVFGFGQVARGAHFVSHNLAAAAICWFVALGLYAFAFRGDLKARASRPMAQPAGEAGPAARAAVR